MAKSLHEKTREKVADAFELAQVFAQARVGEYPDNQELVHKGDMLVRSLGDVLCRWEDFLDELPVGVPIGYEDDGQEILPYTDESYPDCHHRELWITRGQCVPERSNPICRSMCGFGPVPTDEKYSEDSPVRHLIEELCTAGRIDPIPWTDGEYEEALRYIRKSWAEKATEIKTSEALRAKATKVRGKVRGRGRGSPARKRGR